MADEVPPVRADPRRLAPALGGLFDLARRSRGAPTLDVGADPSSSGVRFTLSVDLGPFPAPGADRQGQEETGAGASGEGSSPRPRGDAGENEAVRPPLREVVGGLGGQLWIEALEGTRAEVVLTLPPGDVG